MIAFDRIIAQAAWPLAATFSAILAALMAFAVVRRAQRTLQSRRGDRAHALCMAALDEVLTAAIAYSDALVMLRRLPQARVRASFESILTTDKNPPPERARILRRLCGDLGLVARWHRRLATELSPHRGSRLFGYVLRRSGPFDFVLRAEAAENLGVIYHQPSWRLLVGALDDPNGAVRSAAARSLARIREPESFAALADRLESAAQHPIPEISAKCLKMALASFPATQAAALQRLLKHAHPHVRLLASDVVGLMIERESAESPGGGFDASRLSAEVAEIFITRLAEDEDADVRARAADVVAYLEPFRAMPVLTPLLEDSAWFVRLHAVRAFGQQRFASLALLSHRLTDPHWRVREAAAQTLFACGRSGIQRLFEHLVATEDLYSQEQVAEQIERAGLLPSLLETYGEIGREPETRFVKEMVLRGFGDTLIPALRNGVPPAKKQALIQDLSQRSNTNVDLFMRRWAGSAGVEQSTHESWPADESEPLTAGLEKLDAVEVS